MLYWKNFTTFKDSQLGCKVSAIHIKAKGYQDQEIPENDTLPMRRIFVASTFKLRRVIDIVAMDI